MMRSFLKEEKGQGAIEYILLAGGIIVAAIVIFAIYSKMTRSMGEKANATGELAGGAMQEASNNEMAVL